MPSVEEKVEEYFKKILDSNKVRLYGKTEKEAERFIKEKDRKRKKYHDSHCKTKWSETHTYDLSLNSSTLGIEGSVDFLSEYIDKRIARMK